MKHYSRILGIVLSLCSCTWLAFSPISVMASDCDLQAVTQDIGIIEQTTEHPRIFIFEEYHGTPPAETQEAVMLKRLHDLCGVNFIGLEGFPRDNYLPEIRLSSKDKDRNLGTYSSFLLNGEISQAEWMKLAYPDVKVYGIEDADLYDQAVNFQLNTSKEIEKDFWDLIGGLRFLNQQYSGHLEIRSSEVPVYDQPNGTKIGQAVRGDLFWLAKQAPTDAKDLGYVIQLDKNQLGFIAAGDDVGIVYDELYYQELEDIFSSVSDVNRLVAAQQDLLNLAQKLRPFVKAQDSALEESIYNEIVPDVEQWQRQEVRHNQRSIEMVKTLVKADQRNQIPRAIIIGAGHTALMVSEFKKAGIPVAVLYSTVFAHPSFRNPDIKVNYNHKLSGELLNPEDDLAEFSVDTPNALKSRPVIDKSPFQRYSEAQAEFKADWAIGSDNVTDMVVCGTGDTDYNIDPLPMFVGCTGPADLEAFPTSYNLANDNIGQLDYIQIVPKSLTEIDSVQGSPEHIVQFTVKRDDGSLGTLWARIAQTGTNIHYDTVETDLLKGADITLHYGLNSTQMEEYVNAIRGVAYVIGKEKSDVEQKDPLILDQ